MKATSFVLFIDQLGMISKDERFHKKKIKINNTGIQEIGMRLLMCMFILSIIGTTLNAQVFYRQETNLDVIGNFGTNTWFGGGGVSFADFNGDGLDDLTFGTATGQNIKFFENKGNKFQEVNPPYVVNTYENRQIVWVDYDNDGDKDFFACAANGPNHLYENNGNMVFTEVTQARGLPIETLFTSGATFADINEDGYLDLYITQFVLPNGGVNQMWRWNPNINQYVDFTIPSSTSNGPRLSYCASFFDIDNDDDLDLYVINDNYTHQNSMYQSDGNGGFTDISVPSLTNIAIDAMNAGIGDYDNDGDFDIYITDKNDAVLFSNNGNSTFTDVAVSSGAVAEEWSWTANFFDYDNDRDLDLYISSEQVFYPNRFYVNDGAGNYTEPLANSGGITGSDIVTSATHAIGDYNNDGRPDIMVSNLGLTTFRLYSNQDEAGNNFLKLHLIGTDSNEDAYGAKIDVWIDGVKTITQTHSTVAYHCQNSDYINLGIGNNSTVDSIVVNWPYGSNKITIPGIDLLINGMNEITEGVSNINSYTMPLCIYDHEVLVSPIPSQTYGSVLNIETDKLITTGSNVLFQSQTQISLENGFEIKAGAVFEAEIESCGN